MNIKIGRRSEFRRTSEYIGRGSALGNPFKMKDKSHEERERVCNAYSIWLKDKVIERDKVVMNELQRLHALAKEGDLILGCYCAPKRCHGESIRDVLINMED